MVNLLRESGRKEEVVCAHLPDQGIRTVRDSVRRRVTAVLREVGTSEQLYPE